VLRRGGIKMQTDKNRNGKWMAILAVAVAVSAAVSFTLGYVVAPDAEPIEDEYESAKAVIVTDEWGRVISLTVEDDYNRTVELDGFADRVVSVAPSPTELLFAVGAGHHVVGVDDYSDYPEEAQSLPKVGSWTLNVETIVSLEPDLVVCSDLVPKQQLDMIANQSIPYFIFATRTMEDVYKDVRLAGLLTGHIQEAETVAIELEARVKAVTDLTLAAGVSKPSLYIEYYPLWTYGPGSFGDNMISLAGAVNIAHDAGNEYPELTSEFIIASNPDMIVYTVGLMTTTDATEISSREGWDQITAVSEGAIYSMDDNLMSRYGPRVVEGLEELALLVHPELFD
jgi:iron complex transport system substrate-binding protein